MARAFTRRSFMGLTGGALLTASLPRSLPGATGGALAPFEPVVIPDWVYDVTRMTFCSPGEVEQAAAAGVQVIHTNVVWPYYPLRRDGGGLPAAEAEALRRLVDDCRRLQMRVVLGLPPFPPVELVRAHPEWRVHPDPSGSARALEPAADNLGTRLGCNNGPWGDYLIEVCGELIEDFGLDGYSFDGNYHAAVCYCPACRAAYEADAGQPIPPAANLDDPAYRRYLVWRGARLEDHYRRLQARIKGASRDAVLMSWTVNAGRYGHLLHSPRAMPTRLNLLFDLPMQEWWMDETNLGASVAPAFGAAYLRATTGGRPCASEPYLMSRGNPYGTDSFPAHEVKLRALLAVSQGNVAPVSLGFPGHAASAAAAFAEIRKRAPWLGRCRTLPWGAVLVSEQTRQFYAYANIRERFLPHVFGAFRCGQEEHLPLALICDWNLTDEGLAPYKVLVLPNAAALSDDQVAAVRGFVERGGGLVASCETALCDELGRPRGDFALADVLGVHYQGPAKAPTSAGAVDANFAIALDESYWQNRQAIARLTWERSAPLDDPRLASLVPTGGAIFRGPLAAVEPIGSEATSVARWQADGSTEPPRPALVTNLFGRGRTVYLAAGLDAALWSYAFPYQRVALAGAIRWAAGTEPPLAVDAPMCVQATYFEQPDGERTRLVVHFCNNVDTAAHHGDPASDVPLREESLAVAGIRVRIRPADLPFRRFRIQPDDVPVKAQQEGDAIVLELPALETHFMLVGEV